MSTGDERHPLELAPRSVETIGGLMQDNLSRATAYSVSENLDGGGGATYHLTVPSAMNEVNLSTARVSREGGPTAADAAFQVQLFQRIGAVVVYGGHVETAMKRLLLLLTGRRSGAFSLVDHNWTDLDKKLRRLANGTDARRTALQGVLDWGKRERIKEQRDDTVHAHWWVFAGVGARSNRFHRGSDGATMVGTLEELDARAAALAQYAAHLDALLGEDWSRAILPRL